MLIGLIEKFFLYIILLLKLTSSSTIRFQINEEVPVRTEIIGIADYLGDFKRKECLGNQGQCNHSFKIFDQTEKFAKLLSLDKESGIMTTSNRIDYEELCPNLSDCTYDVSILFISSLSSKRLTVSITIIDINDNGPEWDRKTFDKITTQYNEYLLNIFIDEHLNGEMTRKKVQLPLAIDQDSGINGKVEYRLEGISSFSLKKADEDEDFSLEFNEADNKLWLISNGKLDAETRDFYEYYLIAEDRGIPVKFNKLLLKIHINDVNDQGPVFSQETYYPDSVGGFIKENIIPGTTIMRVTAKDHDKSSPNRDVTYELIKNQKQPNQDFFGVQENGQIVVLKEIDFERLLNFDREENGLKVFNLLVRAKDGVETPLTKTATATVVVPVKDENDTPPKINFNYVIDTEETLNKKVIGKIRENSNYPYQIAYIHVKDPDMSGQDQITCSILKDSFNLSIVEKAKDFSAKPDLKEVDYILTLEKSIDREVESSVHLTVECVDSVNNKAVEHLTIEILDENDNSPDFRSNEYTFDVIENQEPSNLIPERFNGYFIGKVEAYDRDLGLNGKIKYSLVENSLQFNLVNYSLIERLVPSLNIKQSLQNVQTFVSINQVFSINSDTGLLYAKIKFDAETFESFSFQVEARDSPEEAELMRYSRVNVTIQVLDLNDKEPIFIMKSLEDSLITTGNSYLFAISENETIGASLGSITAMDLDRTHLNTENSVELLNKQNLGYRISQDSTPLSRSTFKVNSLNGLVTLSKKLDREIQPTFSFNVLAIDPKIGRSGLKMTSTATVTVLVEDVNDNDPEFEKPVQLWQIQRDDLGHTERNYLPSTNQINTLIIEKSLWMPEEEASSKECKLFTVKGKDADFGLNAELTYHLETGNSDDRYYLDKHTGDFYLINYKALIESNNSPTILDGSNSIYNLVEFKICDKGSPQRCSSKMMLQILFKLDDDPNQINRNNQSKMRKDQYGSKERDNGTSMLINEAVIICMAIIFSILVLVTIILIYMIRNRGSILARALLLRKDKRNFPHPTEAGNTFTIQNPQEKEVLFYKTANLQDAQYFHMAAVPNEVYEVNNNPNYHYNTQTFARSKNNVNTGLVQNGTGQRVQTPKLTPSQMMTATLRRQNTSSSTNQQLVIIDNGRNFHNETSVYQKLNQPQMNFYNPSRGFNEQNEYSEHVDEKFHDQTDDETRDELEQALSKRPAANNYPLTRENFHLSTKSVSDAYKEASFV